MMLAYSPSRALPAFPMRSAQSFRLDHVSSSALAIALIVSVALTGLTADRILRVERDIQPALDDVRQMDAAFEATRVLLRDGRASTAESRIAQADSLAQHFHIVAVSPRQGTTAQRMLAYDALFGQYYVAARRAAAGLSMSADADGSSAEEASLGYTMLRENLDAEVQAQQALVQAARLGTAPAELAAWLTLAVLAAVVLVRRHASSSRDWPVAAAAQMPSAEDVYVPVPAGEGPAAIRLQDAVERMARKRLAASAAAARVAKRNNERQLEVARSWSAPQLTVVPGGTPPRAEMDVYEHDEPETDRFNGLSLVST